MTVTGPASELWVCHLGAVAYGEAVAIQGQLRERRRGGEVPDSLLVLEHPPVYTRGRRTQAAELPLDEEACRVRGIEVHESDRGGRVTYHGPGQLVGYPIMAVADVVGHVRTMESAIVAALGQVGVRARARAEEGPDYTGVWVEDRKIASIGVHVAHGISTHGFAINVENDLTPFSWIVACGLPGVSMTSLARERGRTGGGRPGERDTFTCFRRRVAYSFARAHGLRQRLVSARRLGIDGAPAFSSGTTGAPDRELVEA